MQTSPSPLKSTFGRITSGLSLCSLLMVGTGRGETYNWEPVYGGTLDWKYPSYWAPQFTTGLDKFPGLASDVVNLTKDISGNQTILLNGVITLGTLNLGDATGNSRITISEGTGGSLALNNGGTAAINKTGIGTDLITSNIALANPTTINVSGSPLVINGAMSGTGNLTKTGDGLLILRGHSNTWSGNFAINEGNVLVVPLINDGNSLGNVTGTTTVATGASLSFGGDDLGRGGIGAPSEPISISGNGFRNQGVLRKMFGVSDTVLTGVVTMTGASRLQSDIGGVLAINSAFNVNHALTVGGNGFVSFGGIVSGDKDIIHYGNDGFRLTNKDNTYSGAISSTLGEVRVEGASGNSGAYKNVTAFNMKNSMLRLYLPTTSGNTDVIADTTAINLQGSRIRFDTSTTNPTVNFEEKVGIVTLSGGGSMIDLRGVAAANNQSLTVSDLIRSTSGSTLYIELNSAATGAAQLGTSTHARILNSNSASIVSDDGIIGGWMTTRLINGVGGFVKYDTNGYTALVDANYALNTAENTWAATQNVKTDSNRTLTADRTVNTLSITSDSNRTLDGNFKLTVDSGGIMFSRGASATPTHTIRTATLTSGGSELFLHTANANGFIYSNIIDGAGGPLSIVKAGPNTVQFFAANGYTGTTFINEGTIRDVVGSNIVGLGSGNLNINGGIVNNAVYESDRDFTRTLGTGAGQVQITGGQGSGFSAYGRAIDLKFGNSNSEIKWGTSTFNPGIFTLNGGNATHATTLVNSIDLDGENRYFRVDGNGSGGFRGAIARVEGDLRNGGIVKRGGGVFLMDRAYSYENGTYIQEGTLWLRGKDARAGANVLGNDIQVGNLGALYIDSPDQIGDKQRIMISNTSTDQAVAIALGAGYGDGSGVNFQSLSATGGVMEYGGNNFFISDNRTDENRPIAIQLNGIKSTGVDLVGRAQAAVPNVAIWFGATTANAVYTGQTLTASRYREGSVTQPAYLLGSGQGTLTIEKANVLTGANSLFVGSWDLNSRWNMGGVVYLPEAQSYSGSTRVGNAGVLVVGKNSSLSTTDNLINLRTGELRPNIASGFYNDTDNQYSARNLDVRGGNSALRVQTLNGAGFSKLIWGDVTLEGSDRVLTIGAPNSNDFQINNLSLATASSGIRNYLDIESGFTTINGVVSQVNTGGILRKRSGGTLILNGDNTHLRTELTRGNLVLTHLGANGLANQQLLMISDGDQTANLQLRPDATQITAGNATFDMSEIRFQSGNAGSTRIITVGANATGSNDVNVHVASLVTDAVSGLTNFDLIFDGAQGYRLTVDGGFSLGRDVNFRTRGALLTINGAITDSTNTFNLLKAEQGTLWLNGDNTYSGNTTLNNGYIVAGHNNAFGDGTSAISMASNTFSQLLLSGTRTLSRNITNNATGAIQTIGGIDAGNKTFSGTLTATRGVNLTASLGDVTFTGQITGAGSLTKVGDGTVIINRGSSSPANNYAGATIVADGTLIGQAQASGSPFGTNSAFSVINGTLQLNGLAGAATNTASSGALTAGGGGGRILVNDAADTFNTQFTFGSLAAPTGAGTLVFSSATGNLGGESQIRFTAAPTAVNGMIGTWAVVKNNTQAATYGAVSSNSVVAHTFGVNTGSIDTVLGSTQVFDASGVGGTLTTNRSVYAVRTDTNLDLATYRLSVGDATATGRGGLLLNNGADISGGEIHFGNNQLSVYVDNGQTSTISSSLNNFRNNINSTLSTSNVASTAVFTKFGLGTLELNGTNRFQGNIQINEGTLSLTAENVIPTFTNLNVLTGSIVTIQPNGRVNLNNNNQEFGNLAGANPGSVFHTGGILDLGTATLTVGRENSSQTFGGQIIGGAGSKLSKVGTGVLTLGNINGSQANSLGTLEINQGEVTTRAEDNTFAVPNALAYSLPSTTDVVLRGGRWNVRSSGDNTSNAQRIEVGNNLTVIGGDSILSLDRPEGSGSSKLLTFGNLTLDLQRLTVTAGNTYIARFDGTTTLRNIGRIQTDTQLVLGGKIVGNYTLNKIGGSDLALAADNSSWSGGTVVSSGTLLFGNRGTDDVRYAGTTFVPSSTANAGTGDIILNQGNFQTGTTVARFNATSNVLTEQGQRVVVFGSEKSGTVRVDIGQDAPLARYGLRSTTNGSLALGIGDGGLYTQTLNQANMGSGKWGISAFQGNTYYMAPTLGAGVDNVYRFTGNSGGILNLVTPNLLTGSASVEVGRGLLDVGSLPHSTIAQIRLYGGADYTGNTMIHRGAEFNAVNALMTFHGDLATPQIDIYGRLEARGDGRFTKDDGTASDTVVNLRPGGALQLNYAMDVNDQFVISRQDNSNLGLKTTENKWGDNTAMILDGAQLALISSSGRVNQETIGQITIKGGAGILLSRTDTNGQIVLRTNGGINRIGQSALSIRENGNELGSVNLQSMKMFIDDSSWVSSNTTNGILPVWMINASRNNFLSYSNDTGITNAAFTNTSGAVGTGATFFTGLTATSIADYAGVTGDAILTGTSNVYALRVNHEASANDTTFTGTGGQINIHSGGLIHVGRDNARVNFDTTSVFFGDGTTKKEAIIYTSQNQLRFGGKVSADNMTIFGTGAVRLSAQNNDITGNIQLNGGALYIESNSPSPSTIGTATVTLHADHQNNSNGGTEIRGHMPILYLQTDSNSRNFTNKIIIGENVPLARIDLNRYTGSGSGTIGINSLDILGTASTAGTLLQIVSNNNYDFNVLNATNITGTAPVGISVNARTATFTGAVTSSVGITKTGNGALRFDASNSSFTGGFTLNRGEWRLNGNNTTTSILNVGGTGDIVINNGLLRLANNSNNNWLNAAGQDITINGQATLQMDRNGGTAGVTFTVGTDNGTNTFRVNNDAYVIIASSGDTMILENKTFLADTATFRVDSWTTLWFRDTVEGNGKIVKAGGGNLHFDNNVTNTFAGGFDAISGLTTIRQTNANLGTGPIRIYSGAGISTASVANLTSNGAGPGLTRFVASSSALPFIGIRTATNMDSITAHVAAALANSSTGIGLLSLDAGINLTTNPNMATRDGGAFSKWFIGSSDGGATLSAAAITPWGVDNKEYLFGGASGTITLNPTAGSAQLSGTGVKLVVGSGNNLAGWGAVTISGNAHNTYDGGTLITRGRHLEGGMRGSILNVEGGNSAGTFRTPLGIGAVDVFGAVYLQGGAGTADASGAGNANVWTFHPGAKLRIDNGTPYTGTNLDGRWDDGTGIALQSSMIDFIGDDSTNTANTEIIGALTIAGGSDISITRRSTFWAELNAASLTRVGDGTLALRHDAGLLGVAGNTNSDRLIVVDKTIFVNQTIANGMVDPWIVSRSDSQFVMYDATTGFQVVTASNTANYIATSAAIIDSSVIASGVNNGTRILSLDATAGTVTLNQDLDVYALRVSRQVNSSVDNSAVNGNNRITVRSGGLIFANTGGTDRSPTLNQDLYFGASGTGAGEAMIFVDGTTGQINGKIFASKVTKFGQSFLNIRSDQTQFSGSWVINGGGIQFYTPNAAGNGTNEIILNGAKFHDTDSTFVFSEVRYNFNSGTPDLFTWGGGKITVNDMGVIRGVLANDRLQQIPAIELKTTNATAGTGMEGYVSLQVDGARSTLRTGTVTLNDHFMIGVEASSYNQGSSSGVQLGAGTGVGGLNNKGLYDMRKMGDGVMILGDNSSSFTGDRNITIAEGAVRVMHNGSFGAAGTKVLVNPNGVLEIAVANWNPLATVTQTDGSTERWAVDGARSGNLTMSTGVNLQIAANQTGTQTINLAGGSIMGYLALDYDALAAIHTLGSGITVNLTADSYLGQLYPAGGNSNFYDMGKLNTTTNLNPNDPGLRGSYLQINGKITGNFDLTKVGQDIILLRGQNTYRNTIIESGILQIGIKNGLSTSGTLTTKFTGMFDLNGFDQEVAALQGTGGSVNNSAFDFNTLTVTQNTNTTYGGTLDGNVTLLKKGSGTLTLTGANNHRGGITLESGVVSVSRDENLGYNPITKNLNGITFNGGTLQATENFTSSATRGWLLTGDGTVKVDAGRSLIVGGSITGTGRLIKDDAGSLQLNNTNIYSGDTVVNAGRLLAGNQQSLSALSRHVIDGGTLDLNGFSNVIGSLHSNTSAGTVALGTQRLLIGFDDTTDGNYAGVITGSGTIEKIGMGTQTISGVNTAQTWLTEITNGEVIVAGGGSLGSGQISIGTAPTGIDDNLILEVQGTNTLINSIIVGNFNDQGQSVIEKTGLGTSTLSGGIHLLRDTFIAPAADAGTLHSTSSVYGDGRIRVIEGGTLRLDGTNSYGLGSGISSTSTAAIDGGTVIRWGTVEAGSNAALGTRTVELGDVTRSITNVTRATRTSLLVGGGTFDPASNGASATGRGAFIGVSYIVDGVPASVGQRILVKDEETNPERNGVYQVVSINGTTMNLRRVDDFDSSEPTTGHGLMSYGTKVLVTDGTYANQTFFASSQDVVGINATGSDPVRWRLDDQNPNVALYQVTSGLITANYIDINSTNGTGFTTLGGNFATGNSQYTGRITLQNLLAGFSENRELRLHSEAVGLGGATNLGVEFTNVISEASITGSNKDKLSIRKTGPGVVTLNQSGNLSDDEDNYHGTTFVESGVLQVGNGGSAASRGTGRTSTGVTTVAFGGTIAGTGTINGDSSVTHLIMGVLAPGAVMNLSNTDVTTYGTLDVIGNLDASGGKLRFNASGNTLQASGFSAFTGADLGSVAYLNYISTNIATWEAVANGTTRGLHDMLNITGQLTLSGTSTVNFTLTDNYAPGLGDVIDLADWTGAMGGSGFNVGQNYRNGGTGLGMLDLPTLTNGYVWDVSQFMSHGILIVVVPEVGRSLLFLLGMMTFILRRRRA